DEGEFTFKTDREVIQTRKDAEWPKDMAEADQLWHDILEADLLREQLRIEGIERLAEEKAEKGEEAPNKDEDEGTPREKILKRYTRYLESLKQEEEEDIANRFLTALATSYDPHSEYFSQSELDSFQTNMKKRLQGIGALLSMRDSRVAEIQGIVVGGPADKSDVLHVGDRITAVGQGDDEAMVDITYMNLQKVVDMIRGEVGTKVRLKIIPAEADDDSVTKVIEIIRDEVQLKDKLATAELIQMKAEDDSQKQIGWINLPSFYADMEGGSTSMTADVIRLLDRLKKEGLDGLVIDVRGNGGGSLEEAIKMTGLFVNRGPIVQSKDYKGEMEPRDSRRPEPVYDGPLIVLQDRASASASEILGEASLKFPLPWDEVEKLRYKNFTGKAFPIAELQSRATKRLDEDIDFQYLKEDMVRIKKQVDENAISLNIEKRREENENTRNRTKERNDKRRTEYAKIEAVQGESLKVYKLTLDNVDADSLTLASDFTDEENTGFRLGKNDEEESASDVPDYPFGMDSMKRETLHVMDDLISLTTEPKNASIAPKEALEPAKN
ncbi:MAG: carboxy terminal-processing peptidase, partial [Verrucomicrobiales bacterium]